MSKVLTIAVPAYNVEEYLDKTLSSYCDERLSEDLEVLVIDDGSTDSTALIANTFIERFPKIFKLLQKKNGGHGSAVNTGIENATGKYFRVIDGDDWVITENLVKLIDFLKSSNSDLVCDVKREVNKTTQKSTLFPLPLNCNENYIYSIAEISKDNELCAYIMMHTSTYKTNILKEHNIKLLEKTFYVDFEYIVKTTCFCKTVEFINLEIYQYLVGNNNQSVAYKNMAKRYNQHERVVRELINFSCISNEVIPFYNFKLCALVHTHYKILLLMIDNKKIGRKLAESFRTELQSIAPEVMQATEKRFSTLLLLNKLHISYNLFLIINKLRG